MTEDRFKMRGGYRVMDGNREMHVEWNGCQWIIRYTTSWTPLSYAVSNACIIIGNIYEEIDLGKAIRAQFDTPASDILWEDDGDSDEV